MRGGYDVGSSPTLGTLALRGSWLGSAFRRWRPRRCVGERARPPRLHGAMIKTKLHFPAGAQGMRARKSGSQLTRRWSTGDSNHRSPREGRVIFGEEKRPQAISMV